MLLVILGSVLNATNDFELEEVTLRRNLVWLIKAAEKKSFKLLCKELIKLINIMSCITASLITDGGKEYVQCILKTAAVVSVTVIF